MKNFCALFLATLCLLPVHSQAHHSTAANFTREIIEIAGSISQVRFLNPHTSILILTETDSGDSLYWLVESYARSTYERKGVDLESIEVGTEVTVSGRKGLRPNTLYLREITFADGTRFTSDGTEE